jgi:signal transduction histidine kinase
MADERKKRPERDQTDQSLRTERERTDRILLERKEEVVEVEKDADVVVQRARGAADAVLAGAREKADRHVDGDRRQRGAAVAEERVHEDAALQAERAAADESLRAEREENARALATLLPLERDTTDRYLLTERARSDDVLSNRDGFLGMVSHDLRSLLGGIVMSATVLQEKSADDEAGKATLVQTARIQRYAARMNRLVGDLLDVASIDAGKLAVRPEPADAAELIAEAVDTFHGIAAAKSITLEAQIVERPLPAAFDHDRMIQVLANLITNAIKFTAPGGRISVRGERGGDVLRLAVTDTGTGIPADMLEAIFERFSQVGSDDRRGLGLGLYISRYIVEAHGGRIWAESTPGEGSHFLFTLPLAPPPGAGAPAVP